MPPPKGKICRTFKQGGQCQWALTPGGCRFSHDKGLLEKILEKKKVVAAGLNKHNLSPQGGNATPLSSIVGQELAATCASITKNPTCPQLSSLSATTKTSTLQDGAPKPTSEMAVVAVRNVHAVSQALIAEAPYKIMKSDKQCRFYVNGKHCPHNTRRGGCRDIHDLDVRRANLASLAEKKLKTTNGNPIAQKIGPATTPASSGHTIISAHSNLMSNPTKFQKHKSEKMKTSPQNSSLGSASIQRRGAEKLSSLVGSMKKMSVTPGDGQFIRTTTPGSDIASGPAVSSSTKIGNTLTSMTTIATPTAVSKPLSKIRRPTEPSPGWEPAHWLNFARKNLPSLESAKAIAPYIKDLDQGTASWKLFRTLPNRAPEAEFHHFPKLPYELRQQIWNYVQAEQRYEVRIQWLHQTETKIVLVDGEEKNEEHITRSKFVPLNASPSLLHVNRESREVAKKTYELAFGTGPHPALTYFNFKWDILFLHTRSWAEHLDIPTQMSQHDRDNVRYLAIPLKDYLCAGNERKAKAMTTSLLQFIRLRVLTLIVSDGREDALWRDDEDQFTRLQTHFISHFMHARPTRKRPPKVVMRQIDSWKAHLYGIDGLHW